MSGALVGALRVNISATAATFRKSIKEMQNGLGQLKASLKSMLPSIKQLAASIALAMGAAIAAVTAGTLKLADQARHIQTFSKALGVTTDSYQVLTLAAQKFGIEQDKMQDWIKDTNEKLGEFIATGGGGFKDFMEQVAQPQGVSAEDLIKLPAEERFIKIQALMDAQNVALEQQGFYWESIVSDATYLAPILANGGAELLKIKQELIATGQIFDGQVINHLANFDKALGNIGGTMSGWGNLFVSQFAPQLDELSSRFARFLADNQGIRDAFIAMGQVVGSVIQSISTAFSYLSGSMKTTNSLAQSLGTYFQYIQNIGSIAFTVIEFAVSILWERLKTVVSLLMNIADVGFYAFGALLGPITSVIEAIGTWLTGALSEASSSFQSTQESARYGMDMAAAYAKDGVDTIKNAFSSLPAALGDLMMQAANSVIKGVEAMINGVISRINAAIAGITNVQREFGNSALGKLAMKANGLLGIETIEIGVIPSVQLGEIANQWAGAAAKIGDAVSSVHRDAVRAQSMTDGGNGVSTYSSPVAGAPAVPPSFTLNTPADSGGGGGKGKGGGGGGKGKPSEAEREAKKQKEAFDDLKESLTTLQATYGMTELQARIYNEQLKIGKGASKEQVAEIVTQIAALERMKETTEKMRDTFADAFADIVTRTRSLTDVVSSMLQTMASNIAKFAFTTMFNSFGKSLGGGGGFLGDLAAAAFGVGQNANGTAGWRGGLTWVGERGPELVNLNRGAQVFSNQKSMDMLGGASAGGGVLEVRLGEGLEANLLSKAGSQSVKITKEGINEYRRGGFQSDAKKFNRDPKARG